jgi:hypothetical protein
MMQKQQLLNGANMAHLQSQDPNLMLAMLSGSQLQAQQALLENPNGLTHFIPSKNFDMNKKMKYPVQ